MKLRLPNDENNLTGLTNRQDPYFGGGQTVVSNRLSLVAVESRLSLKPGLKA